MKKYFVLLLLSFVLVSCNKTETQPIIETQKNTTQEVSKNGNNVVVDNNSISNTGKIIETWSGEKIEENANNSAKIYDAILSYKLVEIWQNDTLEEIDSELRKNMKKIDQSIYFVKWNDVYCLDFAQVIKIEWLTAKNIKWVLIPSYNWYTWGTQFLTDWNSLFSYCEKVENWDLNTLKFKFFWDETSYPAAWDKNNLYVWFKNILHWWDLITYTELGKNRWYSKDKNHVYISWWMKIGIFDWIDPNTFEIINEDSWYSKDKNWVYYVWEKLEWIDPDTFDLEKYLKVKESSN